MKKKLVPRPTEAELAILQILWKHGPSTVRFVNDELNKKKSVGYTTTLKLMQIMLEKSILKRDTNKRRHLYRPMTKEKETQQLLLDRFLQTAFSGSAAKLVMQALGNYKASYKEISQIRSLLDDIEGGKNGLYK